MRTGEKVAPQVEVLQRRQISECRRNLSCAASWAAEAGVFIEGGGGGGGGVLQGLAWVGISSRFTFSPLVKRTTSNTP